MKGTMNKAVALALGVTIALSGMAGIAGAQPANNQRFILFGVGSDDEGPVRVVAAGAINSVGEEVIVQEEFNEETGEFTVVDEFVFPEGTLFVTVEGQVDEFDFDERSCVGRFGGTGTFEITGGTGEFAGASGSGTVTFRGIFVAERNPDGSCSEEGEVVSVFLARMRGNVVLDGQVAA